MRQICANAMRVAEHLQAHPRVVRVNYPGLVDHPGHELAKRQMSDFGGVVSFVVDGDIEATARVCAGTELFTLAVSLGGIESLIQHPAKMTHCTTPGTEVAVEDSLLRLAVGLESADELIADLDAALALD
jgi:cystathionine gamma-synthase